MTFRILLIEANTSERDRLAATLQMAAYRLEFVENLAGARAVLARTSVDLALVSAPKDAQVDLDLVSWLRSRDTPLNMPIMVLGEDISTRVRMASFNAGANDYVARPFEPAHLLARISNLMARRNSRQSVTPHGISRRVLVVDDSPTYGNALSDELRKDGHDIAFAEVGRDALVYLESQKADLVILDVFLPDLNGVEVCRRIKAAERTSGIPVLILTGREKSAVRAEAAAANADDFAVKSSDLEAIRAKVRSLLVRSPSRKISTSRLAAITGDTSAIQYAASSGRMRVAAPVDTAAGNRSRDIGRHGDAAPPSSSASSGRMKALSPDLNPNSTPSRTRLAAAGLSNASGDCQQLFDSIVRLTGLSELLARSTVESVCRKLNLDAHALESKDLPVVLEGLELALQLFLPAGEARQRLAALNSLVR